MLRPIKRPEISTGGIILPSGGYRETNRGIVIDKGDQTSDLIPHGAEVFFPLNTEWRIEIDEDSHEELIIVRENDILLWRVNGK